MQRIQLAFCVSLVLIAASCGGGSSGPADVAGPAELVTLQGTLGSRDGSTTALDGVTISCVETGSRDVTDAAGTFRLRVPRTGAFHLDCEDADWPMGGPHRGGHDDMHDPTRGGVEIDGGGATLRPNAPFEWCDVELHLDGGEIVECNVTWGYAGGEVHDGEGRMQLDPLCLERASRAAVQITVGDGCLGLEMALQGFSRDASLDVYLVHPEYGRVRIGAMEVGRDGVGRYAHSFCVGGRLPFGASSPRELLVCGIVVVDEAGDPVFRGALPRRRLDDVPAPSRGG